MSVVTLQLGQCGNQVGHELFDVISNDASDGQRKVYSECSRERFFNETTNGGRMTNLVPISIATRHKCRTSALHKISLSLRSLLRPGGTCGSHWHGTKSHRAECSQGCQIREMEIQRPVSIQSETGLRKQLGQRVKSGKIPRLTKPFVSSVVSKADIPSCIIYV